MVEFESKMERTKMRMIRWICGVSLGERQPSSELGRRTGVDVFVDIIKWSRLGWHGDVERKGDAD